jgi:hypothetical protein
VYHFPNGNCTAHSSPLNFLLLQIPTEKRAQAIRLRLHTHRDPSSLVTLHPEPQEQTVMLAGIAYTDVCHALTLFACLKDLPAGHQASVTSIASRRTQNAELATF